MAQPASPSFNRRGLAWLVAALGVGISLLTWGYVSRQEAERIRTGFLSRAQTQAAVATQRLRSYEEMVHNLRDTFLGQSVVSRDEFARVAQAILRRHTGVQALQWVKIVPAAERAAFEQTATAETGRPFQIYRRQPDGTTRPAPADTEYWPITFVEPVAGNEAVLGYDLLSAPTFPILSAARTGQQFRVSHTFRLLQSRPDQHEPGVVFVLPFARTEPADVPLQGFVQGVFLVQTMLAQSHQLMTNEALDTYYFDVTDDAPPTLLYANLGGAEPLRAPGARLAPPPLDDPADYRETLHLGGRRWLMIVRQNAAWARRSGSAQPELILAAGLVISTLLAFFVHSLLQRTTRIEQIVQERTRQLRASEARLQDILDHSPAIIFLKDLEGRYLLCNEAFEKFCGRPRADIVGRRDADLFTPAAALHARQHDTQVITAGRPMEFEETLQDPADPRTYLAHKFPLLDEQGRAYALCGISTDISDRLAAQQQKLAFERKLLESQKLESLGVLAGGVAHDFNNILTSILGNATLAAMDLPETHRARKQLGHIERAAHRASDLCAQMLAYAGKASFVTAPVSLAALVRDTAALLEVSVGKRVQLELLVDDAAPAVMGDATQLRQIVMNLVINAADAMGERTDGQVTVRIFTRDLAADYLSQAVQAPQLPAGLYVALEVTDNGSGMSPEVLARIFEPFYTTKFSGRGLGLAAVLGIVQSHDGALFVQTAPGQGTTFRLYLPATAAQAVDSATPFPATTAVFHGTLLVIDDEEPVRHVAQDALLQLGLTVHVAADGPSALAFVRGHTGPLDLVLLDLTMPGLPGDETLRLLREIRPELRVIIMSGYSSGETRQRCETLGVAGFLPKPFDLAALTEIIRPHLG